MSRRRQQTTVWPGTTRNRRCSKGVRADNKNIKRAILRGYNTTTNVIARRQTTTPRTASREHRGRYLGLAVSSLVAFQDLAKIHKIDLLFSVTYGPGTLVLANRSATLESERTHDCLAATSSVCRAKRAQTGIGFVPQGGGHISRSNRNWLCSAISALQSNWLCSSQPAVPSQPTHPSPVICKLASFRTPFHAAVTPRPNLVSFRHSINRVPQNWFRSATLAPTSPPG